jgi:hypothetical protein
MVTSSLKKFLIQNLGYGINIHPWVNPWFSAPVGCGVNKIII